MYGMGFDAIVILQFLVNILFMLRQVATQVILKIKQRKYRFENRKKPKLSKSKQQQLKDSYNNQKQVTAQKQRKPQVFDDDMDLDDDDD